MQTETIAMERYEAAKLLRKYREHRAWSNPIDQEIERTYAAIAKGKVVIQALESIRAAGLNESGMPKLAIVRADAAACYLSMHGDGSARMAAEQWIDGRTAASRVFNFPAGTFTRKGGASGGAAITPHIPPDIRPRRGIQNYHVLWEADWHGIPYDPMLLRRMGKGDLWLVCGAWDLTEVERGAMAARVRL